jgi:PhnB protein
MATTGIYLNFERTTEEAFLFYQAIFSGEFEGGISRMGEVPPQEGVSPLPEADKNLVMHVALPILGGVLLMGTDASESMGFKLVRGNNVYISLNPDTRVEADRLFASLVAGGEVELPLQEMFWGDYYGSLKDKFGVHWMISTASKE